MLMQSRNWSSETVQPPNRNQFATNNKAIIRQLMAEGETGAPPLGRRKKTGRLGAIPANQTSLLTRLSLGSSRTNWGLKDMEVWTGMKEAVPLGVEERTG